jgi:hypothetical protein
MIEYVQNVCVKRFNFLALRFAGEVSVSTHLADSQSSQRNFESEYHSNIATASPHRRHRKGFNPDIVYESRNRTHASAIGNENGDDND